MQFVLCPAELTTDSTNYAEPRIRTKFGKRAFSHAGPAAWDSLPG